MIAVQTQQVALELHALIRQIDPVRWADIDIDDLRKKLQNANEKLGGENTAPELLLAATNLLHDALSSLPENDLVGTWVAFRKQISPHYGALALALESYQLDLPDLRPTNWQRSFFHMLAGLGAFLVIQFLPFQWVELLAIFFSLVAWTFEITRTFSPRWNQMLMTAFSRVSHPHEEFRVNSSTWYSTALEVLVLLGSPILAQVAVLILGFCDPIAATIGRKYGKTKLINNRSLEGSIAFFVSGVVIAGLVFFLVPNSFSFQTRLLFTILAPLFGALVELGSRNMDDNFSIPVAVALPLWFIHLF